MESGKQRGHRRRSRGKRGEKLGSRKTGCGWRSGGRRGNQSRKCTGAAWGGPAMVSWLLLWSQRGQPPGLFRRQSIPSPPGHVQSVIFINHCDDTARDLVFPERILALMVFEFHNFLMKHNLQRT